MGWSWGAEKYKQGEWEQKEKKRKGWGGGLWVCLWEHQQAAVHHVSLHRDVFFYTLNDDTHQSRADSCIKPAANMQRPAVWNLLTPPIAAYRRNQSGTRPPPRIYLLSQHTSLLSCATNLQKMQSISTALPCMVLRNNYASCFHRTYNLCHYSTVIIVPIKQW